MMAEYVDEISDPAHRAEQAAYIRQMENKDETPAGKEVVRPAAGFVIKTRKVSKRESDPTGAKVFVNIVQSNRANEPTPTKVEGGTTWALPHFLGPPRLERDKKDSTASTFDCEEAPCVFLFVQTRD